MIFLLLWNIYQIKSQNVLGSSTSTYPIRREDFAFSETDKAKFFYEPKPNSMRVDSVSWLTYKTSYKFNNEGFNNSNDFNIIKPKDTFRIITLGDSHTFGLYVDPDQNYPSQLKNLLTQGCPGYLSIEIINLAVPGYDLSYSIERFAKRGNKYNPDLVVWLIKDDDLFQINSLIKEKLIQSERRWKKVVN